ncbi:MAG: proprotein convertase P-domain-containing protein [Flavobacterium sp.]|nr:proprotein convertase P-domain-containing protein [Flavobacterium sp.]
MIKKLLFSLTLTLFFLNVNSQNNQVWTKHNNSGKITVDKSAARDNFPKVYQLFDMNISPLRQELFSIVNKVGKNTTVISLPNADGQIELFEVNDASNFDAELQAKYPEIRAYSGKGITDRYATLKLSISPQGIQTIVFRTDKENEFIEPYSEDHSVYAVFKSQRNKSTGWACSTTDEKSVMETTHKSASGSNSIQSSAGQLKVMRLALSCNAEYANYFGATSAGQVALVLAAFNNTLTRCNGVYEKDLGVHMNLVASTTNVIYYVASSDPYTGMANWNTQLQIALNTTLTGVGTAIATNNAAYDIGHMFGRTGGGGNAGCIGCICVDGVAAGTGATKGRGITSPSNGVPSGDTFDIDFVVHEMGHQMGANHTFSNGNEGRGVNKEVGSGITIMGYAGITNEDVAANSIDIFHQTSIEQIQINLEGRTCIVSTPLVDNATPVIQPVSDYTIPYSTPFELTGVATDANATDALTYCWEQNDDGGANTGLLSSASETKTTGPNFLSWRPTASPSRYFPKIESVVANSNTTSEVGGTAGFLSEALSSVSRVLNFRLTVRDNAPYRATAPVKVGQTNYTDMKVNVTSSAGPFVVNAPNSPVSWVVGSNQSVTWAVAGTTANNVNAAFVDIFLSTDGGYNYPIQLASKVPNNGTATITVPNNPGASNRIMVKGYKHVFFDISNANFAITAPTSSFAIAYNGVAEQQNKQACQGGSAVYTIPYTAYAGFTGTTTFTATGLPAGVTATFVPSTLSASGTVTMTVSAANNATPALVPMTISATSGATVKTATFYFEIFNSNFGTQALTSPADLATTIDPLSVSLTWPVNAAATSYDVQIATNANFSTIVRNANVTTNSFSPTGLLNATIYYWRVLPKSPSCSGTYSAVYRFTTGQLTCITEISTDTPVEIPIVANTTPFISSMTLVSTNLVTDVNVTVDISHTWVNDMTISLISPSGTEIQLVSRPCTNASLLDINATFDDSGNTLVCATNPAISGTVKPLQLLSGFNGQPINGVWKLKVLDPYNEDGGAINSWSLNVCSLSQAVLATVDNSLSNFVLYPNPNKGNFTVQFNSTSSNEIGISVHDMRGRLIMNNTYTNTGLFSQNVELVNVQAGVYLVTVHDGDKKVVKRIVIE